MDRAILLPPVRLCKEQTNCQQFMGRSLPGLLVTTNLAKMKKG
jgi:hypothetical protein